MTNGHTAKWIGIIAAIIITLGFGTITAIQGGVLKQVERNESDIRRVDKNQAVIIYQLEEINDKIDRLLEE